MEFKFNGSRHDTRTAFLETIKHFSFKVRALNVNKKDIKSDQLKNNKNSFYSYFIKMVLKNSRGTIINAKIRIDGSGDRLFRKRFLTYLRQELNFRDKKIIKNIRLVDSKTNVIIQMADMVAGTIRRYKDGEKLDAKEYWDIIENRIEDCWEFK